MEKDKTKIQLTDRRYKYSDNDQKPHKSKSRVIDCEKKTGTKIQMTDKKKPHKITQH
jgi:hypothetical protein